MGATFKTARGGDPASYIVQLAGQFFPNNGDMLYAAQRQKTRIVERTYRGVDVNGNPFEPYSTNGPYYYYPNGRVGKTPGEVKRNKAAVSRLLRRISGTESEYAALPDHLRSRIPGLNEHGETGARKTRNGVRFEKGAAFQNSKGASVLWKNKSSSVLLVHRATVNDGQGLRFDSYASFKASLGRGGVDLTGPRAPHMMQAIMAKVIVSGKDKGEFALGIYGEKAAIATGHNTGVNPRWKRKHQRYFFGASVQDLKDIVEDLMTRIRARLRTK